MKRLIIHTTILLLAWSINAQSLERRVTASSGNASSMPGITLTYTMGEAFVGSSQVPNLYLNRGFQQVPFNPPALPVEWLEFTVSANGQDARLHWSTGQELNTLAFEVERSLDGISFEKLGALPAAGFSDQPLHYQFVDKNALNLAVDRLYYRIRQLDFDGAVGFSDVQILHLTHENTIQFRLYPNPAQDHCFLLLEGAQTENLHASIINMHGQASWSGKIVQKETMLNLSVLPAGNYYIKLSNGKRTKTLPLIHL